MNTYTVDQVVKFAHETAVKNGALNKAVKWALQNNPAMLATAADKALEKYGTKPNANGHQVCAEVVNLVAALRYASKELAVEKLGDKATATEKAEARKAAPVKTLSKDKETGKYTVKTAAKRASGGGRKSEAGDDAMTLESVIASLKLLTKGMGIDAKASVIKRIEKEIL